MTAQLTMSGTVSVALVALSIVTAIASAFVVLDFSSRSRSASVWLGLAWLTGAAAVLQLGLWCMHLIAVPVMRVHAGTHLDPWMLALSSLAALVAAGMAALFITMASRRSPLMIAAAVGMGLAVACVHQAGMAALQLGQAADEPRLIGSSLAMALMSSLTTVWLTYRMRHSVAANRSIALKSAAAVIIGVAIAGAHYMDMAMAPASMLAGNSGGFDTSSLWVVISGSACVAVVIGVWAMYVNHRMTVGADLSRLAAIVASSNDAIMSANRAGVIRTWNAGAERLYGYTAAEMVGRSLTTLAVDGGLTEQESLLARVASGEQLRNVETVRRHKDGSVLQVSITLSPIRDNKGRPVGISSITRDITGERTAALALRASEERYRLATQATFDVIWDWDITTGRLTFSDAIVTVFGHPPSLMATTIDVGFGLLHPDDVSTAARNIQDFLAGREALFSGEYRLRRADGTYATVYDRAHVIRSSEGAPLRMVGSLTDISRHREAELAMRAATTAAEAANRSKSEFLANMSHEIRTPMNGVLGMLELTLDSELRPEQRDYISTARTSAESLLTLINDNLDFSKIEAGKMVLEPRPFAIRSFLAELLRPLEFRASEKGLRLSVDVDEGIPTSVVGDLNRIRQILINLVGNAIKFTAHGEVTLRVQSDTAGVPTVSGVPLHLHFTIRDTGIGIPADKQRAIFEAFIQADASTTREHGGTGLGLAIASKLVALMGGHIRVESEVGEGSTFHLTLLLRSADDLPGHATAGASVHERTRNLPTPVAHPPIPALRILLADDNVVNQKFLGALLTKRGHVVVIASNGREVLENMATVDFDVILMDVHMPELSGFETTALIRAMEEGTDRHIPIIAVTARAMVGDRERCLDAGMDDYLSKPIHLASLYQALARWCPGAAASRTPSPDHRETAIDARTLMGLVDGDEALLAELVALFTAESPRLLGEIRSAVREQNAAALTDAAHALKGSASSLTLHSAAEAASRLERIGRDGSLDAAPELVLALELEINRSIGALNALTGSL